MALMAFTKLIQKGDHLKFLILFNFVIIDLLNKMPACYMGYEKCALQISEFCNTLHFVCCKIQYILKPI